MTAICFDKATITQLMPMHIALNDIGVVTSVGPTLTKLLEDRILVGQRLLDIFEFRRPRGISKVADFEVALSCKVILNPNYGRLRRLPGVITKMADGQGYFINLSLGAGVFKAFENSQLLAKDFAPTDQTIDMMYLVEMQREFLNASRGLNQQLNGAKQQAEVEATSDPLTGLSNRRALERYIRRLIKRDDQTKFSVILIDLDFFKMVNDQFGHAAGDLVLKEVGRKLLAETRPLDMVARIGGDEFVLVLPDFESEDALKSMAERIIAKLSKPVKYGVKDLTIGASIGATIIDGREFESVDKMLIASDIALYQSKNNGRGTATLS